LVRRLIKEGFNVTVLVRKTGNLGNLKGLEVKKIFGDLRDKNSVDNAVKSVDIIYHIAAAWQNYKLKDKDYWNINVAGTKNLLDAAVKYKIKRFVHCSTVGVLGDVKEIPANENTPINPGDIYQKTKYEAEKLALEYYKKYNLPVVIIRPAGIYGPGDTRFLRLFKAIKNKKFFMIGKGEKLYHLTYVEDLVEGFILAGTKPNAVGQVYIIAGEKPVKMNEYVGLISKLVGVSLHKIQIPLLPVLIFSWFCDIVCRPLGINPPLVPRRLDPFRKDRAFNISKAKSQLGYKPKTDLQRGVKETFEWYRKNNWI